MPNYELLGDLLEQCSQQNHAQHGEPSPILVVEGNNLHERACRANKHNARFWSSGEAALPSPPPKRGRTYKVVGPGPTSCGSESDMDLTGDGSFGTTEPTCLRYRKPSEPPFAAISRDHFEPEGREPMETETEGEQALSFAPLTGRRRLVSDFIPNAGEDDLENDSGA